MKIFLNEQELEKAVHDFVDGIGITLPTVTHIELKAGRGGNGHTASVTFGEETPEEEEVNQVEDTTSLDVPPELDISGDAFLFNDSLNA